MICPTEPDGIGGGLALLWKEEIQVKILQQTNKWIDAHIVWQEYEFFLIGIYGDPVYAEREKVWEQLMRLSMSRNGPWMLLGDFNEILSNEEKKGRVLRNESSFFPFRNMMNVCGLLEVTFQGNDLSWFRFRSSGPVHCKLDRVVANTD